MHAMKPGVLGPLPVTPIAGAVVTGVFAAGAFVNPTLFTGPVSYDVRDPDGNLLGTNDIPSANREWEMYLLGEAASGSSAQRRPCRSVSSPPPFCG